MQHIFNILYSIRGAPDRNGLNPCGVTTETDWLHNLTFVGVAADLHLVVRLVADLFLVWVFFACFVFRTLLINK
jgi:hypothetical protein